MGGGLNTPLTPFAEVGLSAGRYTPAFNTNDVEKDDMLGAYVMAGFMFTHEKIKLQWYTTRFLHGENTKSYNAKGVNLSVSV